MIPRINKIILQASKSLKTKKSKAVSNVQLEDALKMFCHQAITNKVPLSGPIVQEKARSYAAEIGVVGFQASNGWLTKFMKRNSFSFKKVCGESADVDTSISLNYQANILPQLLTDYEANDVFNIDETALFYQCLPDKTYTYKNEKCYGGKNSKVRLTILVGSNMSGTEKLPLYVIGKSAKPRCFKNVKSLPVIYKNNKRAWMTSKLFEEYLLEWDKELRKKQRKILLFVDNCPAHPKIQHRLTNIRLEFFPPNMTSHLQPMDKGIIRSFKHYYRQTLVKRRLEEIEKKLPASKIDVLEAIHLMTSAWHKVKKETLQNCFRNAGFKMAEEDEMSLAQLAQKIENEQRLELEAAVQRFEALAAGDEGFETYSDFIGFDDDVITCDLMQDQDILDATQETQNDPHDSTEENSVSLEEVSEESTSISSSDAENSFKIIRTLMTQSENITPEMFQNFQSIQSAILKN